MKPNFDQSIDDSLTVITFITDSNKKKAIWVHFSCHPTTTDANEISSEFTGVCCNYIEEKYDCNVAFLQGFCGDIRPKLIKNGAFYRGTVNDMETMGRKLANKVITLLKHDGETCKPKAFLFRQKIIPLTFSKDSVHDKVPIPLKSEWPYLVQNIDGDYELVIQYIHICDNLSFVSCNAELVEEYGRFIKQINHHILPIGYANGMVGYICTEKQLAEGGYEAEESIFYFAYPSKLSSSTQCEIQKTFKQLIES